MRYSANVLCGMVHLDYCAVCLTIIFTPFLAFPLRGKGFFELGRWCIISAAILLNSHTEGDK